MDYDLTVDILLSMFVEGISIVIYVMYGQAMYCLSYSSISCKRLANYYLVHIIRTSEVLGRPV